jgi:ABC-2 type transport system ATP-binding protein
MNEVLEIKNLTKKYYNKTAIEDVSLTFERGRIYGLMGPNGSGKTTLMKTIIGLHKQSSGEILLDGNPLSYKSKEQISYMPTENYFYDSFKVKEIVKFYSDMYRDFDSSKALRMLKEINVDENFRISKLSSGLTAKLKAVLALSRNADLYLLDEPFNGIDILAMDTIVDMIVKSHNENRAIIISTHIVNEVEKILDSAVFLMDGKIRLYDDAEKLRQEYGMSIENIYKEVYKNA